MSTAPVTLALMKEILGRVAVGASLSETQAEEVFEIIMSGDATPAQIGGLLLGLRVRGETVEEITGAARIMRAKALKIEAPPGSVDIVGTGGDEAGTFNISTAASFVVAACGVPVAKHGNRAVSSKSGASDVLTALGVNIDADFALVHETLWENKVGFLMAPRHHNAMRHVAGPRGELGTRTIFNLLGPLSNPAGTTRQVVGVFAERWVEPLARVLGRLGAEHAWVVHGTDGLDELTTTGPTRVAEYKGGEVRLFSVTPEEVGLKRAAPADLKGGDSATNAAAMKALLKGEQGAYRDIVVLNAAAALVVAGKVDTLGDGARAAEQAIDRGEAEAVLHRMIAITNRTS
ncbi:anthranilate phosphoribosyltransferase [Paramagnetospirillum magneticum]|uniref:Anthranilate phosphoribosyltransferase n=1 Tax=Paramagnetospirillum magneticum (strain ATCC 700264 / AMB-1) TaxID=342108 RepID=TRPD_PARM1|nr:anthranilate phosphoribosyltransferase [Paramagnetospirillum magneticum]Q2W3A9.1 RecName: Full=Anthranilate phosphoribosyltransferase [Paramagnetospirillum magneticum AMB-1]BAE51666.1 Anthranilate phosphoribosyltransferase [Paramagnetospirillum magneticum AMB-1]